MIARKKIDEAAFWDASVCLDCGRMMEEGEDLEEVDGSPICPHCSGTVMFARVLQEALMKVEGEEE
jgi:DNA-directed RNA polymerase subunit RPC12/RpoP